MTVENLDPLLDLRWDRLVASHPSASVFHTSGWLRALAKTYGFRPVAITTAGTSNQLSDGIVFCEIRSRITGARLISLPFSDHCQPLLNEAGDMQELQKWMEAACTGGQFKYVELRPTVWEMDPDSTLVATEPFWVHTLDLTPSIDNIFRRLHKSCFQRRIRHAEHEHLTYERGSSQKLVEEFYKLLVITRRRHMLLPQPREWFQNLITELSPNAEIRVARKDGNPIAAILTLRHRNTVVFKYGCSDGRFHRMAGIPLLLWKMIEESKSEGSERIDLGRTELDNRGLIEFKDRMGTTKSKTSYLRFPRTERTSGVQLSRLGMQRRLLPLIPGFLFSRMGSLVYRHIA
jgi:CelD/BcsL family acetyltransferase involved in cellulose biosynthesis